MEKETKNKNVFDTLNAINVSEHVEKKNIGQGRQLTYLSWVWAWAEVKKRYPSATYKVYENPANGLNYFHDGKTAYVKCGVTIEGEEIVEYLPVMTGAQRSMPLEQVTSHDVVRSIQRCVTKAIARHGLGLYVYAGEDLPEAEKPEPMPKVDPDTIRKYIDNCDSMAEFDMMKNNWGEQIKADPDLAAYANEAYRSLKKGGAQ